MHIPDTIQIGARTYRVYYIEPDPDTVFDHDDELLGQIDYKGLTIKLLNNQARDQMEQCLLHEIVHGIAFDMGHRNHDEREVDLLAGALHRLIRDNPELFAEDKPFARKTK